ncbi:hypothetical protein VTN96DRAFT_7891 [Rasamsonia emersonii]
MFSALLIDKLARYWPTDRGFPRVSGHDWSVGHGALLSGDDRRSRLQNGRESACASPPHHRHSLTPLIPSSIQPFCNYIYSINTKCAQIKPLVGSIVLDCFALLPGT